jgi:hypothetical protein
MAPIKTSMHQLTITFAAAAPAAAARLNRLAPGLPGQVELVAIATRRQYEQTVARSEVGRTCLAEPTVVKLVLRFNDAVEAICREENKIGGKEGRTLQSTIDGHPTRDIRPLSNECRLPDLPLEGL